MVFRIDLKIFIFLILFYLTRQIGIYSIIMLFAIIHECSHLLAGILLKMKVKRVTLMPMGLSVEFSLTTEDYNEKILKANKIEIKRLIVAIAGPLVNLLIMFIVILIGEDTALNMIIIYSNLLIAIFNLLPIYPLDGGRILKSILSLLCNKQRANIYINKISNIMLFIITFLFSLLIYYYKNIAIVFITIYLWYIVLRENRIYNMKLRIHKLIHYDQK